MAEETSSVDEDEEGKPAAAPADDDAEEAIELLVWMIVLATPLRCLLYSDRYLLYLWYLMITFFYYKCMCMYLY